MRTPAIAPQMTSWTLSDGYTLQGRVWPSDGNNRTAILYLHGIQSHGGWYAWSGAELARHGLPIILPDRRGSGLNTAQRGDVRGYRRWLADLDELATWAQQTWGVERIAVVAVSWGGKLAMAWSAHRRAQSTPMLLLAPGLFPQVDVSLGTKLRIAGALLFRPTTPFEIPLSDPALFTDNPDGQRFIREDQQKLTTATGRFLYQSSRLDHYWRGAWRRAESTRREVESCPWMVCLAERDRIVNNARTTDWLSRNVGQACDIQKLSAAHSLEFEPDPGSLGAVISAFAERLNA